MLTCPYCQQVVEEQAVTCPHCQCQLKAHGHPGILLHRAVGEDFLCQTCLYDADDTCTFPQRPYARDCTLYRNQAQVEAAKKKSQQPLYPRRHRRLQVWLVLAGLVVLALFLALL